MTQLDLFNEVTPAAPRRGRSGAAAVQVGVAAAASPAPKKPKRKRRSKPTVAADAQPTVARGDGVWTITFPAPDRMLSANARLHWRAVRPIAKAWREAMFVYAKAAKLPTGLARVRVDVELRFPTAARKDAPNYHPYVIKPLVDGLGPAREQVVRKGPRAGTVVREVGYGLIPDDTAEFLDGPFPQIGAPCRDKAMPFGQVVVTITDLSCTGITAAWCPTHGDCACPDEPQTGDRWQRPLDDPRCPLHAPTSPHGEVAS